MAGAGLKRPKRLPVFRAIGFVHTDTRDEALEHLRDLTGQELLSLVSTWGADAGLAHLKGLTSRQIVDLEDTQRTAAGRALLQKALLTCVVWPR